MPPFTVRRLTSDDVALMEDLLTVFGTAFEEPATYNDARPSRPYLEDLLGGDHFIAVAALQDGAVVGGLAAYELRKFEQARSEIFIYDLAVAAAHRRQGIATTLIRALEPIAKARGAHVIFVQADCDDGPAIALYESLGTREDVLNFDIDVT